MIETLTKYNSKVCNSCKERKLFAAFYRCSNMGRQAACIECQKLRHATERKLNPEKTRSRVRRSNLKQRGVQVHGIDAWFDEKLAKQDGMCAMKDCNKTASDAGDTLAIDHDHKTNKLRGILCRECNLALDWYERNKHRHAVFEEYLNDY